MSETNQPWIAQTEGSCTAGSPENMNRIVGEKNISDFDAAVKRLTTAVALLSQGWWNISTALAAVEKLMEGRKP